MRYTLPQFLALQLSKTICRCGGIGRRSGLKIRRGKPCEGSSPSTGTTRRKRYVVCDEFLFTQNTSHIYSAVSRIQIVPASAELQAEPVNSRWLAFKTRRQMWCAIPGHRPEICSAKVPSALRVSWIAAKAHKKVKISRYKTARLGGQRSYGRPKSAKFLSVQASF